MTEKFRSLKLLLIEDTEGLMSPEKFRDVRETGTRAKQMTSKNCNNPSTCTRAGRAKQEKRAERAKQEKHAERAKQEKRAELLICLLNILFCGFLFQSMSSSRFAR